MSVLIVGSTALDSIKTPKAENPRLLGGSASHAAVAASFFSPVRLVGVVGEDFPKRYLQLYKRRRIDLQALQILPGKTFHWSGEYEANMNNRRTLLTELGVFETFTPTLPSSHQNSPFVLLANIAPSLQHHVLNQMQRPKFVVPTGAGDSFVGGMMGYLATASGSIEDNFRRAMIYGSVVASFCCEGFGLLRTAKITRGQIDRRVKELERLTRF